MWFLEISKCTCQSCVDDYEDDGYRVMMPKHQLIYGVNFQKVCLCGCISHEPNTPYGLVYVKACLWRAKSFTK